MNAIVYDDIDRHIARAGSIERAATPIGVYLAWCVNLSLVSDDLLAAAGSDALRVRLREITGSELLIKVCHGRLSSDHLSPEGRDFTARRYPGYLAAYARNFGVAADAIYDVADSWDNYDRVAPMLTRWHLGEPPARTKERNGWWRWLGSRRPKS